MGNQSSRDQQKGAESLLSTWTPKQQAQLKEQFTRLSRPTNEKQQQQTVPSESAITTATIPVEILAQTLSTINKPIQSELVDALAAYIVYTSTNNNSSNNKKSSQASFQGFLKAAQNTIQHKNNFSALYTTYTFAYKKYQCSLETFVLWLVKSAIPFWFEGSGMVKSTDKIWSQQTDEDDTSSRRLMQYLIYREQKQKYRQKKREQEEMALWTDDADTTKEKDKAEANAWYDQATQSSHVINEEIFKTWIIDMPVVLILFQLIAKVVFLGSLFSTTEDSTDDEDRDTQHQDRIEGILSPAIEKPSGKLFGKDEFSKLLTPYDYFMLTRSLPSNARSWSTYEQSQRKVQHDLEHKLIFSSRRDGTSWQIFVNRIVNQGATLLVIKAKDGSVFGGYTDEEWKPVTDWYGNSSNFLFRIRYPSDTKIDITQEDQLVMDAWNGDLGSNSHYQYLCWGKQSLPNALAMGGQFDYAGLWLDSDFSHGHSKAGPVCTTYQSPQLSLEEDFTVDQIEVFLMRPMIRDDDDMMENKGGVLSRTEDMEFMEMAGKKLYSRDLQEPDLHDQEEENDEQDNNTK
ncbi:hypothetical protein INT45_000932 [Circinella minor]|uniref:MTOR-associated protein MEAK7 n=1 Tax=Circinella minor TaxID=1195481 RepID=A0A8H7VEX6_9FUNG|nr:hypothetical protein INT45_000932 [Circinella minor]